VKRRAFVGSSLIFATLPHIAAAEPPTRVFRIGWIVGTSAAASAPLLDALRKELADLGYIEGRNLAIETRYADDVLDRVPALARELLRIPVDVVVTQGAATWGVVQFVTSIPVVYVFSADPVEAGFAPSLARPAGIATGLTLMLVELNGKRFELLHEILRAKRSRCEGRGRDLAVEPSELLADLRCAPAGPLPFERHDQLLDLEGQLIRLSVRPSTAIARSFENPKSSGGRSRFICFMCRTEGAEGMLRACRRCTLSRQDHLVLKPKTPSQSAPGGLARKSAMRSR
jgi:hypothetical protein